MDDFTDLWQEYLAQMALIADQRNHQKSSRKIYKRWFLAFRDFTRFKNPNDLDVADAEAFLQHVEKTGASPATRYQAYCVITFLYKHLFGRPIAADIPRPERKPAGPRVLTRQEINDTLSELEAPFDLIVKLLYGTGLTISECMRLRVSDIDPVAWTLKIRVPNKYRIIPMPESIRNDVQRQLHTALERYRKFLKAPYFAGVFTFSYEDIAEPLDERHFWLFPAKNLTFVETDRYYRLYHIHNTQVQKQVKAAGRMVGIKGTVTPMLFRHSFASHLLENDYDIKALQKLLGHSHVSLTKVYQKSV